MPVAGTVAKIRRTYSTDGGPIRRIRRELRVSRNTARKAIRSGETEFGHGRRVQPQPEAGPWRNELDRMPAETLRTPKRDRLTRLRIFETPRGLDMAVATRRFADTSAAWSKSAAEATAAAYVLRSFDPGEACRFDWSHAVVIIDGVTAPVRAAHVRLCHSRMIFVRADPGATRAMVFDAHDKAFAFFGGACARGLCDGVHRSALGPGTMDAKTARAAGRPVETRACAERVEFWRDGQIAGQHGRDRTVYAPVHHIPVLARKPGASHSEPHRAPSVRDPWRPLRSRHGNCRTP